MPEETIIDGKNYFALKNIQIILEGLLVDIFLQLEQYMFFTTISDLCSLAFECADLNQFSHTPNEVRDCWKETVLWVLRDTSITKFEAVAC